MKQAPNWRGVAGVTFSDESERVMREVRAGKKGASAWNRAEVFDLTMQNYPARGYVRLCEWWRDEFSALISAEHWVRTYVRYKAAVRHGFVTSSGRSSFMVYNEADLRAELQRWRKAKLASMSYNETVWMSKEEVMEVLEVQSREAVRRAMLDHKIKSFTVRARRGMPKKVWNRKQVMALAAKRKQFRAQKVPRGWVPALDVVRQCGISRSAIGRLVKRGLVRAVTVAVGRQKRAAVYVEPNAAGMYLAGKVQELLEELESLKARVARAMPPASGAAVKTPQKNKVEKGEKEHACGLQCDK